jgi:hypothetical protein
LDRRLRAPHALAKTTYPITAPTKKTQTEFSWGTPLGKWLLGKRRRRRRWEGSIKTDLKEIGCEEWSWMKLA